MASSLDHADTALVEAFQRAASYTFSSRVRKLLRAPTRCLTVKFGNVVGARTGLSVPMRITTFWGAKMRVRIPEAVSNQLFCCGLFEPSVTAFLLHALRDGHVFVDVGAHYGYFSLLAARLVGGAGQVHAFEPTPTTFGVLTNNIRLLPNVHANQTALWSEPGELIISDLGARLAAYNSVFPPRLNDNSREGQSQQIRVQAVSLDDYCTRRLIQPNFVKIDAESAEYQILQGMQRLLTHDRPLISLEVGDFNIPGVPRSSRLLQELFDKDYAPLEFADGSVRPHAGRTSYEYDNILFVPREHQLARRTRIDYHN